MIQQALDEDLGPGDWTTQLLIPEDTWVQAWFQAVEPLVVAGLPVVQEVFMTLASSLRFEPMVQEGESVEAGTHLLRIEGPARAVLSGERTALNFLQHLSGIATHVRSVLQQLPDREVRVLDTRKTTPGLRWLEKYAVRVGGGINHRMGLFDGILIKDNHLALVGSVEEAVSRARKATAHLLRIQVEVQNLEEAQAAVAAGADALLLDNMAPAEIQEVVQWVRREGSRPVLLEVSGGITPEQIPQLAALGVDLISMGGLIYRASWVDIRMEVSPDG